MDCSSAGFPVHHQLLKLAQTQVHQVGDAIQLSHPLSSPSPPALNRSQNFQSFPVFSNESVICIRWPKYWSFSFNISPSNEYSGLISFRIDWWISLQSKGLSRVFSNTTVQMQLFSAQYSCLKKSMDCRAHWVTKNQTRMSDFHSHTHFTQCSLWSSSHIHTGLLDIAKE